MPEYVIVKDDTDRFTGDRQVEFMLPEAHEDNPEISLSATISGALHAEIEGTVYTYLTLKLMDPLALVLLGHGADDGGPLEFHGLFWLLDGRPVNIGTVHLVRVESFGDPYSYLMVHASPASLRQLAAASNIEFRVMDREMEFTPSAQQALRQALGAIGNVQSIEERAEIQAQQLAQQKAANESAEMVGKVIGAIVLGLLLAWFFSSFM